MIVIDFLVAFSADYALPITFPMMNNTLPTTRNTLPISLIQLSTFRKNLIKNIFTLKAKLGLLSSLMHLTSKLNYIRIHFIL